MVLWGTRPGRVHIDPLGRYVPGSHQQTKIRPLPLETTKPNVNSVNLIIR